MSERREVYVVTSGEWSDYTIEAVYDNREAAMAHRDGSNGRGLNYGTFQVEVWPLFSDEDEYRPGFVLRRIEP